MRRWLVTLVVAGVVATASAHAVQAADYESSFGFAISVPDVWLVLTRAEVKDKAEQFLGEDGPEALATVPPETRRAVFERIRRGELEIFYRREGIAGSFVDNINIMTQPASLPTSPEQLKGLCELLPTEFSRVFHRPIAMDGCEMRELVGRPALYLQFDGAIPGTTTLQYQLEQGRGTTVVITATAANPSLARLQGEFEQIVASMRMR